MPILITRVQGEQVVDLRHLVLRPGRPRDTAIFVGDDAVTTRHWTATLDRSVVGCVTVMASPGPEGQVWQLRGMAVAPHHQGTGVGGALLEAVQREVAEPMWCNARLRAVPFYARHGWTVTSAVFDIPDVGPHHRMTWSAP